MVQLTIIHFFFTRQWYVVRYPYKSTFGFTPPLHDSWCPFHLFFTPTCFPTRATCFLFGFLFSSVFTNPSSTYSGSYCCFNFTCWSTKLFHKTSLALFDKINFVRLLGWSDYTSNKHFCLSEIIVQNLIINYLDCRVLFDLQSSFFF